MLKNMILGLALAAGSTLAIGAELPAVGSNAPALRSTPRINHPTIYCLAYLALRSALTPNHRYHQ